MLSGSKGFTKLGHQRGLDGIRGIAILAVLVFHFNWPWLPGGFFGVDIFFTLSGFLITTLLLEEQFQSGGISLGRFFSRRLIRLYPALVCLVIVSTAFALLFHRETSLGRNLAVDAGVLLYVANWLSMADPNAWFGGMPHTWSVAVEAQFYVLWALLIAFFARRYAAAHDRTALLKALTAVAITIFAVSVSWRALLWVNHAEWLRMYLGTDTRLDGVFAGAIAALVRLRVIQAQRAAWPFRMGRLTTTLVEVLCAALVVLLLTTIHFGSALPGCLGFALVGVATAVLILSAVHRPDSMFGAAFRWHPLTWLGQVSYSVYIWHVPVEKLLGSERLKAFGLHPLVVELARLVIALLMGAISYYGIERTFLRLKRRFESIASAEHTTPAAVSDPLAAAAPASSIAATLPLNPP